jgi:hypothetical protein
MSTLRSMGVKSEMIKDLLIAVDATRIPLQKCNGHTRNAITYVRTKRVKPVMRSLRIED